MSGDLNANKIMGAILATAFVIVGVGEGTKILFHSETPEKMGYFVDAPEEAEGGAAEVVLPPDWGTVLPTADVAKGEAAFAACKACHTINQGGANGTGPNLFGIVGGPVMHAAGFAYSDAMQAHKAEAPTWGYDELDQFLTSPQKYVPGTKMSFAGIRNQETRVNLIAYLRSQGSGGFAVPAPDPSRQPGAAAPAEGEAPADGTAAPAEGQAPAAGAETAAAPSGGPAGGAPTTGAAAQSTTQAAPAAPSAATSGQNTPR